MDEKLFAELEASLKEGMEILRDERPAVLDLIADRQVVAHLFDRLPSRKDAGTL